MGYALSRIKSHIDKVEMQLQGIQLPDSGCYMFLHTLTRDVVSLRPESYEDVIEAEVV
eukprot:gene30508-37738_t